MTHKTRTFDLPIGHMWRDASAKTPNKNQALDNGLIWLPIKCRLCDGMPHIRRNRILVKPVAFNDGTPVQHVSSRTLVVKSCFHRGAMNEEHRRADDRHPKRMVLLS